MTSVKIGDLPCMCTRRPGIDFTAELYLSIFFSSAISMKEMIAVMTSITVITDLSPEETVSMSKALGRCL